jgi:hypothetical protein
MLGMSGVERLQSPPPAVLLKATRRLLRPLVRLMMQSGITYPILADLLRTLFVEVATRDVLVGPRAQTDSRISLLSGVHRKEIRRLRALPPDTDAVPDVVTISSQIIAVWLGGPAYLDAGGRPKPLPRVAKHGTTETFDGLISSVTRDVRPRAVLDDWLTQGIVQLDAADNVHLNAQAFIPRTGGEEQIYYFSRNLHDHIAAAVANISAAATPPFLDRSVHYDRLSDAAARDLEAFARQAAMQALLEVNRHALTLVERETGPEGAGRRVNLGVYVFAADEIPSAQEETGL